MAEITKLSVGKALEKLRTNDVQKSKTARLDEKSRALDEETALEGGNPRPSSGAKAADGITERRERIREAIDNLVSNAARKPWPQNGRRAVDGGYPAW